MADFFADQGGISYEKAEEYKCEVKEERRKREKYEHLVKGYFNNSADFHIKALEIYADCGRNETYEMMKRIIFRHNRCKAFSMP